ncbi:MAG: hypothetical protein HOV87_35995 [Catenulispora sp.]|nr:hypothetical protein [Catenulispora sp.]
MKHGDQDRDQDTPTVALVTSDRLAEHGWQDLDSHLVQEALVRRGVDARLIPWDGGCRWQDFDVAVLRSPWDLFVFHPEELLPWVAEVEAGTTVLNPPNVIRQVMDKRYLERLAVAGVAIVPTRFVDVGQPVEFPAGEFVVKPVTSGAARDTARYRPEQADAARAHVAYLHRSGRAAMIQPYVASVDIVGERSLMFVNGVFDHAIVKQAALAPDASYEVRHPLHPRPQAHEPSDRELDLAHAALDAFAPDGDLLSARVDMLLDAQGAPRVLELELVAPVLFLPHSDGAVERFADAIIARLPAALP